MHSKHNYHIYIHYLLITVITLCLSAQVLADRGQWLFGLGVDPMLPGTNEVNIDSGNSGYAIDQDRTAGYKYYLGYDLSSRVTLEASYTDLGKILFTNGGWLTYEFTGFGISYYFPENSKGASYFIRAGTGKLNVKGNVPFGVRNEQTYSLGFGVDMQFDNGFALRGEYEYFDEDAQVLTMSINKRFGEIKRAPIKVRQPDSPLPEEYLGPGIYVFEGGFSKLDEKALGLVDKNEPVPARANKSIERAGAELSMERFEKLSEMLGVIEGLKFIEGSTKIWGESAAILDKYARSIRHYSDFAFLITGHTDNIGSNRDNEELSLARAKAVGTYLISKGVNPGALDYMGVGEEEPMVANSTPEGRALNNRIELELQ